MKRFLLPVFSLAVLLCGCAKNGIPEIEKAIPQKLETPTGLSVDEASITSTSFSVAWDALASEFVSEYQLEWKKVDDQQYSSASVYNTHYALSGLEHSTTYCVRLRALSSEGEQYNSDYTGDVEAETLIIYVVTPPQNVRVVPDKTTSTSMLVEWDAVANSVGYQVRCSDVASGTVVTAQTTETSVVVRGLTSNTEYNIAVQTLSRSGSEYNSDYSGGLLAKTKNLAGGIFNASDFVAFAQAMVEEYNSTGFATGADWADASGVVHIKADLDMTGIEWTPIPMFSGKLEGNGFKITNLVVSTYDEYSGLFKSLKGATISNLTMGEGCRVSTTFLSGASYAGAFAAIASDNTIFENLNSYVTLSAATYMGGICGAAMQKSGEVVFKNCTNYGEVTFPAIVAPANVMIAGICGASEVGVTYENCKNVGPITAFANGTNKYVQVAGIVGGGTDYNIVDCSNDAAITIDTRNMNTIYAGGIVGRAFRGNAENCSNSGTIAIAPSTVVAADARIYLAGCFGSLEGNAPLAEGKYYNYKNISNSASITINCDTEHDVLIGGIIGLLYCVDIDMDGLSNSGSITLSTTITGSAVAGLVGTAASKADSKPSKQSMLRNSTNTGDITFTETRSNSAWQNVAGIVGRTTHNMIYLENCVNRGNVTMDQTTRGNVGGIVSECKCDILNCQNYGTIYVTDSHVDYYSGAGGIVARLNADQLVSGSKNYGTIIYNGKGFTKANANKGIVGQGGIVGIQYKGRVENCENYGTVLGNEYDASYGLQSYLNAKGAITGWGGNDAAVTITNCKIGGAIGECNDSVGDMGVSAASLITAENYSTYIYGGNAKNGVTVSGCTFAQN